MCNREHSLGLDLRKVKGMKGDQKQPSKQREQLAQWFGGVKRARHIPGTRESQYSRADRARRKVERDKAGQ